MSAGSWFPSDGLYITQHGTNFSYFRMLILFYMASTRSTSVSFYPNTGCQQMIHPNEKLSYTIEKVSREHLWKTRKALQTSASENEDVSNPSISTEKPKSRRTPRREVRWLDLGAKNRSLRLESIKRRFEDRLDRFLSSSSNSLLRRIKSPMDIKQRHNLHQCPGYLREEITLASDVSKSVIVSHAFPSQFEVCSICGQLVQYNRTEPSIIDDEKVEAPHFPLNNLQNKASLSSSMEDTSNISEIQSEIYGYSASHSESPTQSWVLNTDSKDSVSCQWEDCGEVFTHRGALIHHVHNGKFLLVLGCTPSVTEVEKWRPTFLADASPGYFVH